MSMYDADYRLKCQEVNQLTSTMTEFMDFLEEELGSDQAHELREKFNSRFDQEDQEMISKIDSY